MPKIWHRPVTGNAVDHGVGGSETRPDPVVARLPQHDPVMVVRLPSIQRIARNAKFQRSSDELPEGTSANQRAAVSASSA